MRMFHKYYKNPGRPNKRTKACNEIAGCMRQVRIKNPGKYDAVFTDVFGRRPRSKSDDVMAEQEVYETMLALDEEELKLAQAKAKKARKQIESVKMRRQGRPVAAQAARIAEMTADEDIKRSRAKIKDLEAKAERGRYKKRPPAKQVKGITSAQRGVIEDPWQSKEERKRARELAEDWRRYMSGEGERKSKRERSPTGTIFAVEGGAFRARINKTKDGFCWVLYDPNNLAIDRGTASTKSAAARAINKAKDQHLMRHGVDDSRDVVGHVMPPPPEASGKDRIYNWYLEDRRTGEYIDMGAGTKKSAERELEKAKQKLGLEEGRRERGTQRAEMMSRRKAKQFKRPFKPAVGYEEIREYDFPKDIVRKAVARKKGKAPAKRMRKPGFMVKYRLGMDGYYGQIVMPDGKLSEEFGPYKKIEQAERQSKLAAGMMAGTAMRVGEELQGNPGKLVKGARQSLSKLGKKHRIKNPSVQERLGLDRTGIERSDVDEKVIFSKGRLEGLTRELDKYDSDIFYMGYFYGVIDGVDLAGVQNYLKRRRIRKRAEKELFNVVRDFKVRALAAGQED